MKLTFYLFERSVKSFDDAMDEAKFKGDSPYQAVPIRGALDFEARAFFQKNRETLPKWLGFFSSHLDLPQDARNSNNSLLLLLKLEERIFAVTAGYAFSAIDRQRIEPDFGLRVTLNSIDTKKLKGIDSRRIDTRAALKRLLVSNEGGIEDFDLDIDEDLISMVSGTPQDSALARRLVGGDSLSLTGEYSLPDLDKKCEALLGAFESDAYREHFKFIDHLRLVKDADLKAELNSLLDEALTDRRTEKLLLAYPELDFWTSSESYKVTSGRKSENVLDISLGLVYDALNKVGICDVYADRVKIVGLNEEGEPVTPRRTLFDYCVFETEFDGERFLLSLGKWFRLAKDYVEEVDNSVRQLEMLTDDELLPPIRAGQKEADYNLSAVTADRICLDKVLFQDLPGRSRIEVCDLLTSDGKFIVLKRYNGSSTLSHMFSQGFVSAVLFHDSQEYRQCVANLCPKDWNPVFNIEKPDKSKLTFVYAIAGIPAGDFVDTLPFFSKVNLRHFAQAIKRMSYQLKLCRIPLKEG